MPELTVRYRDIETDVWIEENFNPININKSSQDDFAKLCQVLGSAVYEKATGIKGFCSIEKQ